MIAGFVGAEARCQVMMARQPCWSMAGLLSTLPIRDRYGKALNGLNWCDYVMRMQGEVCKDMSVERITCHRTGTCPSCPCRRTGGI